MAGKIFKYDMYDVRKFSVHDVKLFIDIGASIGTMSIMARILFPFSRVLAFEPQSLSFEVLSNNMRNWAVECHNIALGPGIDMHFDGSSKMRGQRKFYLEKELDGKKQENSYTIKSKLLSTIIKDYNIDLSVPYIIKIDCEGGERFLREDPKAVSIIKGSLQTMIELHFGLGGPRNVWIEWLSQFEDTHYINQHKWLPEKKKLIFIDWQKSLGHKSRFEIQLLQKKS